MLSGAISPNLAAAQCNDVIICSLQQYLRPGGLITESSHTLWELAGQLSCLPMLTAYLSHSGTTGTSQQC